MLETHEDARRSGQKRATNRKRESFGRLLSSLAEPRWNYRVSLSRGRGFLGDEGGVGGIGKGEGIGRE